LQNRLTRIWHPGYRRDKFRPSFYLFARQIHPRLRQPDKQRLRNYQGNGRIQANIPAGQYSSGIEPIWKNISTVSSAALNLYVKTNQEIVWKTIFLFLYQIFDLNIEKVAAGQKPSRTPKCSVRVTAFHQSQPVFLNLDKQSFKNRRKCVFTVSIVRKVSAKHVCGMLCRNNPHLRICPTNGAT